MWRAVTKEVDRYGGTAVVSHEMLARVSEEVRARAVGGFGGEVRVVITSRDLGRQLPSLWQENVKNRNEETYGFFLHAVFRKWASLDAELAARRASRFWRAQDVVAVAERWARLVGPDAVTIVTVPPPGTGPDELWTRFARACDLPELDYEIPLERQNQSMGSMESEVLRRMNSQFPQDLPWPRYEALVKRTFAVEVLAGHRSHGRLGVPASWWGATEEAADRQIAGLGAAGYRVIGDLEELRPELGGPAQRSPDEFTESELLELALELLATVAATEKPSPERARPRLSVARLMRRLTRKAPP